MVHTMEDTAAYRYARDASGRIWDISEVDDDIRRRKKFYCFGCGGEMDAVIHVSNHFFRHTGDEGRCSRDAYLRGYARQIVSDRFRDTPSFPVTGTVAITCPQVETCRMKNREQWHCGEACVRTLDLRQLYDTCTSGSTLGGVPVDLLFTGGTLGAEPLAIQFRHTDVPVSVPSTASFIEVELRDEQDSLRPIVETVDTPSIRFHNIRLASTLFNHDTEHFGLIRSTLGHYSTRHEAMGCTCHSLNEHFPDSLMELSVSKNECARLGLVPCDLWASLLLRSGLDRLRYCRFCSHYHASPEGDDDPCAAGIATPTYATHCSRYQTNGERMAVVARAFDVVPYYACHRQK